jgi:MoaA/NifB/PqqE/SkfB family radical SAM enzyme
MALRPGVQSFGGLVAERASGPGCPACAVRTKNEVSGRYVPCRNAFARKGVLRVNWDCYDQCNLSCPFCFRSRAADLGTEAALAVVDTLAYGGIEQLAFTGGDASLRSDLSELINSAHAHDMKVEVLTNAQHQNSDVLAALIEADLVGLSIDGASPSAHDEMRAKKGNFKQVFRLIDYLDVREHPYVIRTVVSARNRGEPQLLSRLLSERKMLVRWTLQQFVPIGDGFRNQTEFAISPDNFRAVCDEVKHRWRSDIELTFASEQDKIDRYMMLNPAGDVFCRVSRPRNGELPVIGNLLADHIADLAAKMPFDATKHLKRYSGWFSNARHRSELPAFGGVETAERAV